MVTNVQKVAQTAYRIFSRLYANPSNQISSQNVGQISSLMNRIENHDVNFDMNNISQTSDAPVSYIDIFEDPVMTMAIFIIRDGHNIPLHDHPKMYGFCKVIHGCARLKSYSNPKSYNESPPEEIIKNIRPFHRPSIKPVVFEGDSVVTDGDNCCVITPDFGTYHEISAINGPVAFLDILAPSYDHFTGSRICQYYQEIQGDRNDIKHQDKPIKWLAPVSQPREFWCEPETYEGPSVIDVLKDLES